jgi:hypothetical protein
MSEKVEWTNDETRCAWSWLTDEKEPGRLDQTRRFVEAKLGAALSGRIRLTSEQELKFTPEGVEVVREKSGDAITMSDTARSILVTGLIRSFGEDAPDHVYDLKTWSGHMAFNAALSVDWRQLADRLLRRFTLEYVPGDVD